MTPYASDIGGFWNGFLMATVIVGFAAFIISGWILGGREKGYNYVPPGGQIIWKSDWETIEKNFARELRAAKLAGINIGRDQVIDTLDSCLKEQKDIKEFGRPYSLLGIKIGDEHLAEAKGSRLKEKYNEVKKLVNDKEVQELCDIRITQINNAIVKMKNIQKATYSSGDI